ncbi:hypothetical protein ACFL6S_22085 [Candidatus Poribacteria bacterium]
MVDNLFALIIVAIAVGGGIILGGISMLAKAISGRAVKQKELQELRGDISEIKEHIEDIKEQLADIIIRLG